MLSEGAAWLIKLIPGWRRPFSMEEQDLLLGWHILSPVWPCAFPLLQWPCSKWPGRWPRWSSQTTCVTWCSRSSTVTVSEHPNLSQAGRESIQGKKLGGKGLFLPCSLSLDLWLSPCPFGKDIQWYPPCEMWILEHGQEGLVCTLCSFFSPTELQFNKMNCCAPVLETSWSGALSPKS